MSNLDTYLEFLFFGKRVPGGKIIEVGRVEYRKCLGVQQSEYSYDEAAVYCHYRRLSFLRVNLLACNKSYKPDKCREMVEKEIDRIENLLQMHKDRLTSKRNEEYN